MAKHSDPLIFGGIHQIQHTEGFEASRGFVGGPPWGNMHTALPASALEIRPSFLDDYFRIQNRQTFFLCPSS
jgi:hypothetical protein